LIKSMTGYGSAKGKSGRLEIAIEIKGVNNRYLDTAMKMPRMFISFEDSLKALVQKHISRGKVDVFVSIDSSNADDIEIKINRPLAEAYLNALKELSKQCDIKCEIDALELSRFPEVFKAEKREADLETLREDICAILAEALTNFDAMRKREGEKLGNDFTARLDEIERLIAIVDEISPRTVAEYRKKLEARMCDILQTTEIDDSRILMEAALYADRVAINEESVRLRSHIAQMREMLESQEAVGRKMDFLIQEFNREANTIGSKGNDSEMARIVVDIKAEIEKMREQAQNVE